MKKEKVPEGLLDLLICPACQDSVTLLEERDTIRCHGCGLLYPVLDGIPVMLVDEAVRD